LHINKDQEYSDIQVLVNGGSFINRLSGTGERWGDYFGIQTKFNSPGTVYTTGYYSLNVNNNSTWVSELFSPDTNTVQCDVANSGGKIFPNPTGIYEDINFQFYVEEAQYVSAYIYDLNGRLVSKIVENQDCGGTNILTFSTAPLSSGTYIVKILDKDNNEVLSEKFVKN
jgi:hypothetical protein